MRGNDDQNDAMFIYTSPDSFVPKDHPLRPIRAMTDEALSRLSKEFSQIYSHTGRPSIPPERLLKALLLQALYSIRSNRLLAEQIGYSILFRWFIGMGLDERVWDHSTFSQNQDRLIGSDVAAKFFQAVNQQAQKAGLLSDEHFTVDGTLLEAWASVKSFQPKDGPPKDGSGGGRNSEIDFRGEKRSNDTHVSKTDPQAKLFRKGKGKEAKLSYMGHLLTENRNGLIVSACVTEATGTAEREAAEQMLIKSGGKRQRRRTVGADKNYDTKGFVSKIRSLRVTPHVAQNTSNRASAIDGRTTRHEGYQLSQRDRKRIEEPFGWMKMVAMLRKVRYRGTQKLNWHFLLTATAYNLVRMRNLGVAAS
jgi:transposase